MTKTKNSNQIGRRTFLKLSGAVGGSMVAQACGLPHGKKSLPAETGISKVPKGSTRSGEKLIYVAIDGLHPKYLELDANGYPGGGIGNWLMPNVRKFIDNSLWYPNARAFLPAATDMNHLNALAGTSTAQTGIIGVWAQPTGWDAKGKPIITHSHLSHARDDQGRSVDTLFHAWKRRRPGSRTLFISGKEWVAGMFRQQPSASGVDILITGSNHPEYLKPPHEGSFADPLTDLDAACDPESKHMRIFGLKSWRLSNLMTRAYTGQGGLLTRQMESFETRFPHDQWIVESTLEIFKREDPGMAYILLAQCDDAGHCIGNAWDPTEFIPAEKPYQPPRGCEDRPEYQLVSSRNKLLYREPILDVLREVDAQFGRLLDGFEKLGILDQAKIILLSDHSAVNHLSTDDFSSTDVMGLLEDSGLVNKKEVYAFSVSGYGVLYWRKNKEQVQEAKAMLQAHRALNPETGRMECPWWLLDREDMKNGIEGICLPGELYHEYFVEIDREKTMTWPDLVVLGKNGWQIPIYNGHIPNVGVKAPKWTPPFRIFNGGHGAVDTLPIVAAISVPGGKTGIEESPIRISDLGVTAASLCGLDLRSTTIGEELKI